MQRQNTGSCLTTSSFRHLDRAGSGSPTEYHRRHIEMQSQIGDKVYELNTFIHEGISKFLDKQAVLDLIHQYDHEEIFIGGEEGFLRSLLPEPEEEERGGSKRQYGLAELNRVTAQRQAPKRKAEAVMSSGHKKNRSTISTDVIKHFISVAFVKIFGIRATPASSRHRADSELFDATKQTA